MSNIAHASCANALPKVQLHSSRGQSIIKKANGRLLVDVAQAVLYYKGMAGKVTIKTGKRSWTMTVVKTEGRTRYLESDSGKQYVLRGRTMTATRVGRDGKTRLYNWSVDKVEGQRPPKARTRRAAAKAETTKQWFQNLQTLYAV